MTAVLTLILFLLLALVKPVYAQPATIRDSLGIIEKIISILAPAAGIAFLAMMLLGAFRFIKSAGDPKKITGAQDTLRYAILGVILVAAAWLLLLVIKNITGVNVTTVDIPITP